MLPDFDPLFLSVLTNAPVDWKNRYPPVGTYRRCRGENPLVLRLRSPCRNRLLYLRLRDLVVRRLAVVLLHGQLQHGLPVRLVRPVPFPGDGGFVL